MCRDGRALQALRRQRGALNLYAVGIVSALLAGAGMLAMLSLRSERNLFDEAAGKVRSAVGASAVVEAARQHLPGAQLRKCVIKGRTVVSNEDCKDDNPTSRAIKIQSTRGVEAPRTPVAPPVQRGSDPGVDKMIEKQGG